MVLECPLFHGHRIKCSEHDPNTRPILVSIWHTIKFFKWRNGFFKWQIFVFLVYFQDFTASFHDDLTRVNQEFQDATQYFSDMLLLSGRNRFPSFSSECLQDKNIHIILIDNVLTLAALRFYKRSIYTTQRELYIWLSYIYTLISGFTV